MDIGSGKPYPASALSNFAPHPFIFDGIECASMEGFLQSLKFEQPHVQIEVCRLVGRAAKFRGKKKNWKQHGLWWKGKKYDRLSFAYTDLIRSAYDALATNDGFCRALLATGNATLTHSIGRSNPKETILTEQEFVSNLYRIREKLKNEVV